MPRSAVLPALAISLLAATSAGAQDVYVRSPIARARAFSLEQQPRAVLGISTSSSGGLRDTLGLLVGGVTPGGPADKAGIEEGNRLQAINGVSLRATRQELEDWEGQDILYRRLTRELRKAKPGDEVTLAVYAGGRTRTVKVKTVEAEDLAGSLASEVRVMGDRLRRSSAELRARADSMRKAAEERPTLGIGIGSTGSARDTLGVLVMRVTEGGPADKAGIEEGSRIQAIDGVDLRASREDAADEAAAGANVRRLSRAIAKKKAGDEVELRVHAGGQTRTVRVKTMKAADLPHRGGVFFFGDDRMPVEPAIAPMPPMPPMAAPRAPRPPRIRVDANLDGALGELAAIGPEVRWNVERALRDVGPALDAGLAGVGDGVSAALAGVGRALDDIDVRVETGRRGRTIWF